MNSGKHSNFKIECDNLKPLDLQILADLVREKFTFGEVYGVPRGGLEFAEYCKAHIDPESNNILVVDNVLTTGASMEEIRISLAKLYKGTIIGVVIFARGKCPNWVTPIFQMWEE